MTFLSSLVHNKFSPRGDVLISLTGGEGDRTVACTTALTRTRTHTWWTSGLEIKVVYSPTLSAQSLSPHRCLGSLRHGSSPPLERHKYFRGRNQQMWGERRGCSVWLRRSTFASHRWREAEPAWAHVEHLSCSYRALPVDFPSQQIFFWEKSSFSLVRNWCETWPVQQLFIKSWKASIEFFFRKDVGNKDASPSKIKSRKSGCDSDFFSFFGHKNRFCIKFLPDTPDI